MYQDLPSAWVRRFVPLIRQSGRVLDLAAGGGRHTRLLLDMGFAVTAVDRDVAQLQQFAGARRVSLEELRSLCAKYWNPIGVPMANAATAEDFGFPPLPANEYDPYLRHVLGLIISNAETQTIRAYLEIVERQYLMLSNPAGNKDEFIRVLQASVGRCEVRELDLETGDPQAAMAALGDGYDGIVVTNYLHRPLFPGLGAALASGGALIYETFAAGNERLGRPRNPDFLLRPGELLDAFAGLTIVAFEQGEAAMPRSAVIQRLAAIAGPLGKLPQSAG